MRCSWSAHGLMDDFQWRRTDGVLRGDGGGLDVGEGLRCVADKCLNFATTVNFVSGFVQCLLNTFIFFLQLTAFFFTFSSGLKQMFCMYCKDS